MHEPRTPRQPKKRGETICVRSFVACLIVWVVLATLAVNQAIGGPVPRYVVEFFFWIWVLSMIPICVFICSWTLNYPPGTRRQVRPEPPSGWRIRPRVRDRRSSDNEDGDEK